MPSLGVVYTVLGQALNSGDLSDLLPLVGPEVVQYTHDKINGADSEGQGSILQNILDSISCLRNFIADQLVIDNKINERVTEGQVLDALERCVSDDFKEALGNFLGWEN